MESLCFAFAGPQNRDINSISRSDAPLELPDTVWPRSMLYLCDWGEANVSCIDCVTKRVFLVHMAEKYHRYVLAPQAFSLQEQWEQCLAENQHEEKQGLQNRMFLA